MTISYRRLVSGSALLGAGEIATRLLSVVSLAVIARSLGVADFGAFAVTISVAMIWLPLIDLGQNALLGRQAALDREASGRSFVVVVRHKLAAGMLLALLAAGLLPWIVGAFVPPLAYFVMVSWATVVSILDSVRTMARGRGELSRDSAIQVLDGGSRLAMTLIAAGTAPTVVSFCSAYLAGSIMTALTASVWTLSPSAARAVAKIRGLPRSKAILREAFPMAIGVIALSALHRMDQVFVGTLADEHSAGIFAAALQFSVAAVAFARVPSSASYNALQTAHDDPPRIAAVARRTLGLSFLCATAIVTIFVAAGPLLIRSFFGRGFEESAPILSVLAFSLLFHYVSGPLSELAVALRKERLLMWAQCTAAIAAATGHYLAIPAFGIVGAAWVDVGAAALLALMLGTLLGRNLAAR